VLGILSLLPARIVTAWSHDVHGVGSGIVLQAIDKKKADLSEEC
jgi:hypothetical protein